MFSLSPESFKLKCLNILKDVTGIVRKACSLDRDPLTRSW